MKQSKTQSQAGPLMDSGVNADVPSTTARVCSDLPTPCCSCACRLLTWLTELEGAKLGSAKPGVVPAESAAPSCVSVPTCQAQTHEWRMSQRSAHVDRAAVPCWQLHYATTDMPPPSHLQLSPQLSHFRCSRVQSEQRCLILLCSTQLARGRGTHGTGHWPCPARLCGNG